MILNCSRTFLEYVCDLKMKFFNIKYCSLYYYCIQKCSECDEEIRITDNNNN